MLLACIVWSYDSIDLTCIVDTYDFDGPVPITIKAGCTKDPSIDTTQDSIGQLKSSSSRSLMLLNASGTIGFCVYCYA